MSLHVCLCVGLWVCLHVLGVDRSLIYLEFSHQRLVSFCLNCVSSLCCPATFPHESTSVPYEAPDPLLSWSSRSLSHYHMIPPLGPAFGQNLNIWTHVGRLKMQPLFFPSKLLILTELCTGLWKRPHHRGKCNLLTHEPSSKPGMSSMALSE